jgi:hypothetical protein
MPESGFYPASEKEPIVFGAGCPPEDGVLEWVSHMKKHDISRVCCLLTQDQLYSYKKDQNLKEIYPHEFGESNVCWVPIEDFHLCDRRLFEDKILPFLKESAVNN